MHYWTTHFDLFLVSSVAPRYITAVAIENPDAAKITNPTEGDNIQVL